MLALALLVAPLAAHAEPADDLTGLWKAKRWFGPEARGPLIVRKSGAGYEADMAGYVVPARMDRGELVFDLPNALGRFRGKWEGRRRPRPLVPAAVGGVLDGHHLCFAGAPEAPTARTAGVASSRPSTTPSASTC
jgi:hypothetical protein